MRHAKMGTMLVTLGVLVWLLFTMIYFVFLTSRSDGFFEKLRKPFDFNLNKKNEQEFGIFLMQVTGIFWVTTGLIITFAGVSSLEGLYGDIILGIIILAPVWIGALIVEKRRK
jgi:hypothetical protein